MDHESFLRCFFHPDFHWRHAPLFAAIELRSGLATSYAELVATTHFHQHTVERHLAQMKRAGMITSERLQRGVILTTQPSELWIPQSATARIAQDLRSHLPPAPYTPAQVTRPASPPAPPSDSGSQETADLILEVLNRSDHLRGRISREFIEDCIRLKFPGVNLAGLASDFQRYVDSRKWPPKWKNAKNVNWEGRLSYHFALKLSSTRVHAQPPRANRAPAASTSRYSGTEESLPNDEKNAVHEYWFTLPRDEQERRIAAAAISLKEIKITTPGLIANHAMNEAFKKRAP